MIEFWTILFLLTVGHFLCDYPLQGDFLARGKNHVNPIPGVPWYQCLTAHAGIHSGMVYLITGSLFLGLLEFVLHFGIDYTKCSGKISYNTDQFLHFLCKILIAWMFVTW